MRRILLCPPDYFGIEYEINPWMHVEDRVDKKAVHAEYNALKETFRRLSVEIFEIPPQKGLPDMVYTANFGAKLDKGRFLLSNFFHPQRQGEVAFAEKYLREHFDFEILTLPSEVKFEGQAELFPVGDSYFFGWGKRTDYRAKEYIEKLLGKPLIDLELVDKYYYHLDTCFAPLSADTVVVNPDSFKSHDYKKITDFFTTVIETSPEDNRLMACNLVPIGQDIVIGEGISKHLQDRLTTLGYRVHQTPMSEYLKGGGSVYCCSLYL